MVIDAGDDRAARSHEPSHLRASCRAWCAGHAMRPHLKSWLRALVARDMRPLRCRTTRARKSGVQHRRQCALFDHRDDRPRLPQGLGNEAFAGFLMGREVAKRMLERGHGTILFTGCHGERARPQRPLRFRRREARAAGTGPVYGARTGAEEHPRRPCGDRFGLHSRELPNADQMREEEAILAPDHIAQNYVMLNKQPRTA